MAKNYFFKLLLFVALISAALVLFPRHINRSYDKAVKNIEIAGDGAWCWFQDPRAVDYNEKTYIGSVNEKGDIVVSSFDHKDKTVISDILHSSLQADDHASPSILIRQDGRIMIFYSAHTGDSLYYKTSIYPEDISSWSDEESVGTNTAGDRGYTYPNPVQLSGENNKIYLFWRGGNFEPTFSTSIDGISWSEARTLFNVPGERPYMKVFSNGKDKIYFTFTDGHPNETDSNSIYFAYYQNGSFYKADGTFIKKLSNLPLSPNDVDIIYNSSQKGTKAWNWDIANDQFGNPIVIYATFPNINDHHYRYAHWNGRIWDDNEITSAGESIAKINEPYYSGGIALDHENPSVAYLSKEVNGIHEIEKWSTSNGGESWSSEKVTSKSAKQNIRPVVPRNHNIQNPSVIWLYGDYFSYTKYKMALEGQFTD